MPQNFKNPKDPINAEFDQIDKRLFRIENHLWGPQPGKLGNQPIFSFAGVLGEDTNGAISSFYPLYFNGTLFEVRAIVNALPTVNMTIWLAIYDISSSSFVWTSSIILPSGSKHVEMTDINRKVESDQWCRVSIEGGDNASDLTVSWRIH